jgi:hypothetical protein
MLTSARKCVPYLVALSSLTGAGPALAQETTQALIERAIRAHGGQERLARARADRVKMKGTLAVGTARVPFVSETTVQMPGQLKSVVEMTTGGKSHTVVHLINGERSSVTIDGKDQPLTPALRAQVRQMLDLDHAMRLVPLLRDPLYRLSALPEMKLSGRPTAGVRVTVGGQRELRLYFDKATALLVKTEYELDGPDSKKVRHEAFYGAYREFEGHRRPGKIVAFRDGTRVMDAEVVEVKYFARIGPAEFTRP